MIGLLKMARGQWWISYFFSIIFHWAATLDFLYVLYFHIFFTVFLFLIRCSSCILLVYLMCFFLFLMIFRLLI
jgi:hypothetical protein